MRRLTLFIFAGYFLLGSAGLFIGIEFNRFFMSRKMHERVEPSFITHLVIPVLEMNVSLTRIKDDEVSYSGRMYDIICEYVKDGCLHIFCMRDRMDESLLEAMKMKSGHDNPPLIHDPVVQFVPCSGIQYSSPDSCEPFTFPEISEPLANGHALLHSPPPKTA